MGLPTTGVALPITLIKRGWTRKDEVIMDLPDSKINAIHLSCHRLTTPSDVRHAFSAVALYETRAPYVSTLIRGRAASDGRLKQVAFAGNHGNLGWTSKRNHNPLILAPFAWMSQQLHDIGIQFDFPALEEYFPLGQNKHIAQDWIKGPVFRAHGYEHLIGRTVPSPGRIVDLTGDAPAIEIHATVRLRGYGRTTSDPAVPGYKLNSDSSQWVRSQEVVSRPSSLLASTWPIRRRKVSTVDSARQPSWPRTAAFLDEAAMGQLEARLLGLTS